ncbi:MULTISPECIES: sulfur carrier protein ThiS [Gracilibacillus]|uniref:Thiamine biosynthesis protein ThiS n=1 Tax=Gracilibacillus dipsosauri TaxID=178340 RepID=A0A317KWC9_9BACI|nr:sulfur carrier protein ThiS [Gracilibacillus dipsosauri]PWU67782.1 thiamine biosynthesis protein ThiS [Gracilibacillus dipsosauri]
MKLLVNGNDLTVNSSVNSIQQLIEHLELRNKSLIVEHNQQILKKEDHEKTIINDGDRIEIVHFVGGG